ncbi:uncharacterized protein CDAR_231391 [Caerostris darwini]|uniref:Uncharacterized protein n=1 Tax=Caerostris darwini TaxID=1538125 RepID=A0AAV4WZ35_9ARAC|nr:uncharacterized protein CDAR_231391 [Caerostris darwini]
MEHSTTLHSDSLETSSLSLKFTVSEFHFRGGNMKLKCTATISRVYIMSNEELVSGTGLRQQTSGLQITENMSHVQSSSTIMAWTSLWTISLCLMFCTMYKFTSTGIERNLVDPFG